MQPKQYRNAKIALLNIELELKAEVDNAEMRIGNVQEYQAVGSGFLLQLSRFTTLKIVDVEWEILYDKLRAIEKSGAKIVLSRLPIGDVATQWFADR